MQKYTIMCTEEQARKALELGAPINIIKVGEGRPTHYLCSKENRGYYAIPTTEQMMGWLRSQGFRFCINDLEEPTHWESTIDGLFAVGELSTPKEATLAAIDAALDYLIKSKEK